MDTLSTAAEPGWTLAAPSDYPVSPYPGSRATGSWTLTADGALHALAASPGGGWQDRVTGRGLEVRERSLVLSYGSNLSPAKLARLYRNEAVHALQAEVHGWAAAWCDARRGNGDVIATLVPAPGTCERHAVLAVTAAQLDKMDRWEGHPRYYRREPFRGIVHLADGTRPYVQVYLGTAERRPPLLLDGQPVYLRDQPYDFADAHVRSGRA